MVASQEIANPRRILAVSLEESTEQLSRVIKDLTGTAPEPTSSSSSLAGTTHNLDLRTAYYSATVPIWLDLISAPSEWAGSFLSDEAKEVLEVLGGVVVVFAIAPAPASASPSAGLIREVGRVVREGLGGWEWDGVSLAVGVGEVAHPDDLDDWDEACADAGLEFVHLAQSAASDARNEFGEKVGISRVLEALESNDWASLLTAAGGADDFLGPDEAEDADDEDSAGFDVENMDFGFDKQDFEGLKQAIWEARMEREEEEEEEEDSVAQGNQRDEAPKAASSSGAAAAGGGAARANEMMMMGDDDDVQKVEQMMQKLLAVRDLSAGLPDDQRKRMAAKAVGEVMRDL